MEPNMVDPLFAPYDPAEAIWGGLIILALIIFAVREWRLLR